MSQSLAGPSLVKRYHDIELILGNPRNFPSKKDRNPPSPKQQNVSNYSEREGSTSPERNLGKKKRTRKKGKCSRDRGTKNRLKKEGRGLDRRSDKDCARRGRSKKRRVKRRSLHPGIDEANRFQGTKRLIVSLGTSQQWSFS